MIRMELVKELINVLYCGKKIELADACLKLGFSEDDLTDEELDTINKELFRCSDCGEWTKYKEFNIRDGVPICSYCYDKWFEEEDY